MSCAKVTLTLFGIALDGIGLLLTVWPQLSSSPVKRLRAAVRRRTERPERFVRRLLRRQKHYTMAARPGVFTIKGRTAGGIVSPPADANEDRTRAFLLAQAVESQERLNELERQVADHPGQWRDELQSVRSGLEARIAEGTGT